MPRKASLTPFISYQDRAGSMKCVTIPFTTPMQVPPKECCILKASRPRPREGQLRVSGLGKDLTRTNACVSLTKKTVHADGGKEYIRWHKMIDKLPLTHSLMPYLLRALPYSRPCGCRDKS